jgi:hypothetical protein
MDKRLKKNIEDWGKANPWFASSQGKCELSRLARIMEKDLVDKGYKYGTKKLFDQLDKQLNHHVYAHKRDTDHLKMVNRELSKGFMYD